MAVSLQTSNAESSPVNGKNRLRKRVDYTWNGTALVPTSEIRYIYDGMLVVQERNSSNVPTITYTRGTDLSGTIQGAGGIGGLLGRSSGYSSGSWTTHNHYHADGNGNITFLINSSQTIAASYKYNPFGGIISSSGTLPSANTYRFSSKEIHVNSGMYYYGYRFYDPNLQRWLNRDPIGDNGWHKLYSFNQNSPITKVDSLGLLTYEDKLQACYDSCGTQWTATINRCRQTWGPKPNSGFWDKCLGYTVGQVLNTLCDTAALTVYDKCMTSCPLRAVL